MRSPAPLEQRPFELGDSLVRRVVVRGDDEIRHGSPRGLAFVDFA